MFRRVLNLSESSSFFLFGARGTGKTTLMENAFGPPLALTINLLLPHEFQRYGTDPALLSRQVKGLENDSWVLIDEIQRVPQLLDLIHHHIEKDGIKFALTGSSARKLRRGAANLLAGRAFTYLLFPLTSWELADQFSLEQALRFGTLPRLFALPADEDRALFLESYATTYVQEEIWHEHLVRALPPFHRFLQVAAQMNGEILNYAKIGAEAGIDGKTAQAYFTLLEDTLIGFFLPAHHRSVRKQQTLHPKFYFFDAGVKRAIDKTIRNALPVGSSEHGCAFEHFIIVELVRLSTYLRKNYSFSYLRTKDDAEIDLLVERPGAPAVLVEIKATNRVQPRHVSTLAAFLPDFPKARAYLVSNDPKAQRFGQIEALPWPLALRQILQST